VFADLESMADRPLDKIRNLHWGFKIPVELTLAAMFLIWGSVPNDGPGLCLTLYDERCTAYVWASWNGFLPMRGMCFFAAISAIILALTSDVFGWILATPPFQFLGKVSYPLYLIHMLIVVWLERDTYDYFVDTLNYPAEDAVVMIFLIYTPFLLVVAWVLEIIIDRPAKEFAGEFDRQIRRNRPKPMPALNSSGVMERPDEAEYYSCSEFSKRIWPIYAFIAWLLFVFVTTEIFAAFHTYKE